MASSEPRTSETHPLRVDFVADDDLGLPGKLGMTIAPGVIDERAAWKRDLEADLDRISTHYGATTLVVLIEDHELDHYGIPRLISTAEAVDLEVIRFPIVDVSVPGRAQTEEYAELIGRILDLLADGKTVVVHCRGGIGRTGVVCACVLAATGHDADEAIGMIREARSDRMVETPEQEEYVRRFATEWRERGA